jgi:hypothetical protein
MVALLASSTAHAAALSDIKGDVLVNHGAGFAKFDKSIDLAPGDKIKVGKKATAKLVYSDGCSVTIPGGALATVAKQSPCSFRAQLTGRGESPEDVCRDSVDPRCCGVGDNVAACGLLVGGIAGVGGGIAAALATQQHSYSTFIPPAGVTPPAGASQ